MGTGRFTDPPQARTYSRSFFYWNTTRHRHSGQGLLIPEAVYQGRAEALPRASTRTVCQDCLPTHVFHRVSFALTRFRCTQYWLLCLLVVTEDSVGGVRELCRNQPHCGADQQALDVSVQSPSVPCSGLRR